MIGWKPSWLARGSRLPRSAAQRPSGITPTHARPPITLIIHFLADRMMNNAASERTRHRRKQRNGESDDTARSTEKRTGPSG